MTTTTGDTSSLTTPASLSGGDLVSRLLAATPPYLYNVPLTPHSFFFSEMLRSFVQAKADASTSAANPPSSVPRRRKRSWRDARERPLELTTKDKTHLHLHHHQHHQQQQQLQQQQREQHKEKYFKSQPTSQDAAHLENRFKIHNETINYPNESKNNNQHSSNYEEKSNPFITAGGEPLKPVDENRSDYRKENRNFFDDASRNLSNEQQQQSAQQDAIFASASQKVKPEEQQQSEEEIKNCNNYNTERNVCEERQGKMTNQELSFLADQKNKLDYAARNFLPGVTGARAEELHQAAKGFGLSGNVGNSDFMPAGPLWYPPYPSMTQPYPGIDPLHFFIDLRVSGHIWDRKMNERQLPFKSKHCSAFSVPQTKEYNNRPLNLTRDEAATSSSSSSTRNNSSKNLRGTHFILRNLTETYKDIREMEKNSSSSSNESSGAASKSPNCDENSHKDCQGRSWSKSGENSRSSTSRENQQQDDTEQQGKDIRALIGLELVVDYVKEPKEDSAADDEPTSAVSE